MQKTSLFWVFNLILGFSLVVFACQKQTEELNSSTEKLAEEEADGMYPYKRLSSYGFFKGQLNQLQPAPNVLLYQPASSLFTDYALKTRFIFFPEGEKAQLVANELEFPEGTVIIKNFYYPIDFRDPDGDRRIIETRLMVNSSKGWEAFPDIWN